EARRRKQEEAISRGEDPGLVDPFYWGGSEEGLEESKAERPLISQKEQEVLSLVGSGLTNGEVAGVLHITLQTVKNRMFAIIQKLNISDRMQGVVKGIETGLIDLSSLVLPDFDPAILDTLSPKERELVTLLARSYGGSTNKELAYELGVIEQTIKNHISSILRKTGARDRTQIAVFFLEAKRRKQEEAITRGEDPESVEVFGPFIETVRKFREKTALSPKEIELLVEVGAGLTNEEIARKYGISEQTIRNHMRSIALKFGTSDRAQLVVRGIEQGLIDLPSLVPPDFKPSVIEQLSNTEREVLAFMVRNNGGTTNREIAQEFGVSEYIVKKYMDSILKRTGAKNRTQAAVFYLEAERREEKRKALLPEEKEALSLAGQGFTNEEAAIQMGIPVTTIVNIHTAIRSKLGVSNVASAIVKAAGQGQIDLSSLVPPDFDPYRFGDLTDAEAMILNRFVETNGVESYEQVASALGISKAVVNKTVPSLLYQLGAKNKHQAMTFILEARKRGFILDPGNFIFESASPKSQSVKIQEVARREKERAASDQREKDILIMAAQGLISREIAERVRIPKPTVDHIFAKARKEY
ncbi:MAG: LuxR C-terminal-related transcriptional regulator, partial [Patescibacteria group bacterium]